MKNINITDKKEIYLTSAYVPCEDITIIKEDIWFNGELVRSEIKGWYYGEPNREHTKEFKNKGVICTYGYKGKLK